MSAIEIVRYEPAYAESVAQMWNRSSGEWGGGSSIRTAEQIREDEENSDAMLVLLAVCGNEVAGYCSIGEYQEESGVLYVQWLNVRPDFHGRKVGKMLMRQAVEEAIALGWPRIDLYTWGGNMKAVPLYKKCGFFWEDRENAVHFMNFIPQVAACEALSPYFPEFDWYSDLVREIDMKPDGEKDNGFETYAYLWRKGDRSLRVDFERRSHGVCLIETEDYCISVKAEQAEPIFGDGYAAEYVIVNKSGAPLALELRGESEENIAFDWEKSVSVEGELRLSARYFVNPVQEEQSNWRSYPAVRTKVRINGLEALLRVGVATRFPAAVKLTVPPAAHRLGSRYTMYADIRNHLPQPAKLAFELPDLPWIEWGQRAFDTPLPAEGKVSLAIPYTLKDYGNFGERLQARLTAEDGLEISFSHFASAGFGGPGALYAGETDKGRMARNGGLELYYHKDKNGLALIAANGAEERLFLPAPLVGKPYSSEFTRKKPLFVETKEERGGIGYRVTYRPEAFPQLLFHCHAMLYADGTAKLWHEWENDSALPVRRELWASQPVQASLYGMTASYRGRILENIDSLGSQYDAWDSSLFNEPWLFMRGGKTPVGICWGRSYRLGFRDWNMELESAIDGIGAGEKKALEPIYFAIGAFPDWESFRGFAMGEPWGNGHSSASNPAEMIVHEDNPFVRHSEREVSVTLRDDKQVVRQGKLTASYRDGSAPPLSMELKAEDDDADEAGMILPRPAPGIRIIDLHARRNQQVKTYSSVLFSVSPGEVLVQASDVSGYSALHADNGFLSISASPGYYPGLHSIRVNGREWLASGFPEYSAKSWWNPWIGGLTSRFGSMSAASVLKEKATASEVVIGDVHRNKWRGIAVSQQIAEHDKLQGATMINYYVMMPGVPVLLLMTDIRQQGDSYLSETLTTEICLNVGGKPGEVGIENGGTGWLQTANLNGGTACYPIGKGEVNVREKGDYAIGRDGEPGMLQIIARIKANNPSFYGNLELSSLSLERSVNLPNGRAFRSSPTFLVFTDKLLPEDGLQALRRLLFPFEAKFIEET